MTLPATLLLTRSDVAALLDLDSCIAAVEEGFRLHGTGDAVTGVLGIHVPGGGFHIKAGTLRLRRPYFAAKTNANFPNNPAAHGLPTIQGVIVLADAEVGTPLALLDSMEITTLRTGAASAVAAKYLAREDARSVGLIGCGNQGWVQLRALRRVRPLTAAPSTTAIAAAPKSSRACSPPSSVSRLTWRRAPPRPPGTVTS